MRACVCVRTCVCVCVYSLHGQQRSPCIWRGGGNPLLERKGADINQGMEGISYDTGLSWSETRDMWVCETYCQQLPAASAHAAVHSEDREQLPWKHVKLNNIPPRRLQGRGTMRAAHLPWQMWLHALHPPLPSGSWTAAPQGELHGSGGKSFMKHDCQRDCMDSHGCVTEHCVQGKQWPKTGLSRQEEFTWNLLVHM